MRLSELERPFIVTSLVADTLAETISTLKTAEYQGAKAFEIHLPLLGFPDAAAVRRLRDATSAPLYATCRRDTFYELLGHDEPVSLTDEERIERLVGAVDAGFDAVDMELDTFDRTPGPSTYTTEGISEYADEGAEPAEITDDPDAIERQRRAIGRINDRGGEVILSAHTYTHLTPDDAVGVARRMTDRGADFGKIVGVDRNMDEAIDTLRAHLALNRADVAPYALMAIGEVSRIVRPIAPMFGSAWVFAQPELVPGGFHDWPLVDNQREILRRIDWRTAYEPHGR